MKISLLADGGRWRHTSAATGAEMVDAAVHGGGEREYGQKGNAGGPRRHLRARGRRARCCRPGVFQRPLIFHPPGREGVCYKSQPVAGPLSPYGPSAAEVSVMQDLQQRVMGHPEARREQLLRGQQCRPCWRWVQRRRWSRPASIRPRHPIASNITGFKSVSMGYLPTSYAHRMRSKRPGPH
jgi:hypothetical protein